MEKSLKDMHFSSPASVKILCANNHDITDKRCMICGGYFNIDKDVVCVYNGKNEIIGHIDEFCYKYMVNE